MPHRIYFWRIKDRNGRWYQTSFRTIEATIRKEHPEAERVETDFMEIPDIDPHQAMYHPSLYGIKSAAADPAED